MHSIIAAGREQKSGSEQASFPLGSGEDRTVSGVEDTDMDGGVPLVDGLRTVGAGQHFPADGTDFVFHSSR